MAVISSNAYLSLSEMAGNAQYILDYLTARGWTKNAVCAMLGNMQSESTINPGIWQSLKEGATNLGFGLVQWTPATKILDWQESHGVDKGDIDGQLERIIYEKDNKIQWQKVTTTMTFEEFSKSTDSVETLAELFELNYEQHAGDVQPDRKTQARYWYDNLSVGDDGSASVIKKAVDWAVGIANDDTHGYDQGSRDGPNYDCSSFLSWAYYNAGLNTRPGYTPSTSTMYDVFTDAGFNDVTASVDLESGSGAMYGDVLLQPGHHTAMYIGNGQIVHASINENGEITGGQTGDQTGKEICTRSYYNKPWTYVLRYKSGGGSGGGSTGVSLVNWIPAA